MYLSGLDSLLINLILRFPTDVKLPKCSDERKKLLTTRLSARWLSPFIIAFLINGSDSLAFGFTPAFSQSPLAGSPVHILASDIAKTSSLIPPKNEAPK